MKPTTLAAILALPLASGAAAEDRPAGAGDPERGRAIAAGAFAAGAGGACQSCHGIDGAGDAASGFPRLSGQPAAYLEKSLADYASGRRKNEIMSPIAAAMTPEEWRHAAVFYAGTTGVQQPAAIEATPDELQAGGTLAAVGNGPAGVQGCINCHGPDGSGMGYHYPALAGQSVAYLRAQFEAWRNGTRTGDPENVMREIAKRLSDAEIAAVTAYYAAIRPRLAEAETTAATGREVRP